MEIDRAEEVLKALADGRDPATGEQFPPDSPYQQADTVRALFMALDALDNAARRARRQANRPAGTAPRPTDPNRPKMGSSWSPEEEQRLRDAFTAHRQSTENLPFEPKEASFADWRSRVAAAHGRTTGAIAARLVRLGLIEDAAANRAGRGNRLPSVASAKEGPNRPMGPIRPPAPAAPSTQSASPAPRELTEEEKDNLPF